MIEILICKDDTSLNQFFTFYIMPNYPMTDLEDFLIRLQLNSPVEDYTVATS